ncbi:MAG TPA: MdtA/MuxA family multidrug efflux RND transporter periplasmic adaptor subunit [Stellaceae bacterium]|nr:MdtA/MuxA family multidrug efflux RND transporter periplasmic adaptor subunit [Stellaceae bacterium]
MNDHDTGYRARDDRAELITPIAPRRAEAPVPGGPTKVEPRPSRAWRSWIVTLILIAAVAAALVWLLPHPGPQPARSGRFTSGGPMPVVTATAQRGAMPVTIEALGTVAPLASVTVRTQINGQLTQIAFREGQTVKKGDFLAQIDPRPYQLALDNAQGQLLKDQALLKNAQLDFARYDKLLKQDSVSRQQRDTQEYLVHQYEGTVKSDQAQVDTAKLNLAYCHIVAPVSGRVGLRQVDEGNYVQTSDPNGIVVITQEKPISVIFTVPEDDLPAIMKRFHAGAALEVTAFDRSHTTVLAKGTLATADNEIDTTTGTVKLRAQFDNDDESLFPNQFVNVELLVDTLQDSILVPTAAIQRGAPGTFVYVVKDDSTVAVRPVKLGPADGEKVAVVSGLAPGEKVVVDGADKLRDGAKVAQPGASPAPEAAAKGGADAPAGGEKQPTGRQARGRSAP